MESADTIPEDSLFIKRGEQEKEINFRGMVIKATIKVFTNRESDELSSEFTTYLGAEAEMDAAGLIEARIVRGLISINTTFGGKPWIELTEEDKKKAIDCMDPQLRERLSLEILSVSHISPEEKGFLSKRS